MSPKDSQLLGPTLARAKTTLRTALSEACSADLDRANTGELIRIEEVLAIANEAAKEAVSIRRRLGQAPPNTSETTPPALGSRDVDDAHGVRWAVFAVHPSAADDRPSVRERFRDGWLSFDCGSETRRLVPIPANWQQMADGELLALCANAEPVARRAAPAER